MQNSLYVQVLRSLAFESRDPELQSWDPEIKKITRVALMGHRNNYFTAD